jgi:hypothetical protein
LWKAEGTESFWKLQPKVDQSAALFLADPRVEVNGTTLLTADRLCDRQLADFAWYGAAGLGGLGLVCLVLALALGRKSSGPDASKADLARLAGEEPLSTHSFKYVANFFKAVLPVGAAVGCGYVATLTPAGAVSCLRNGAPIGAAILALVTVGGFAGAVGGVGWVLWLFLNRVSHLQVCPSGLRWHQGGRRHLRLWAEVESADRQEHQQMVQNRGQPVLLQWATFKIRFRDGEELNFISDGITDFDRLTGLVASHQHAKVAAAFARRSQSSVLDPASAAPRPWPRGL